MPIPSIRKYCLVFVLFYLVGCATGELMYYAAPSAYPGGPDDPRAGKTAGYWIGRHPDPDRLVLDPQGIQEFNERQRKNNRINDLADFPEEYSGKILRSTLEGYWRDFSNRGYFLADGTRAAADFFDPLRRRIAFDTIEDAVPVRYAVITRYANQKFLPTDAILTEVRLDVDFDELQNSALDMGTPVAVLRNSSDGLWVYTVSELSEGWVRAANVGMCPREQWIEYLSRERAAVAVSAKADVYLDPEMTGFADHLRMGARLPLGEGSHSAVLQIMVPLRDKEGNLQWKFGYISASEASAEPLPYTPRTILTQAFKLLNAPYGWGGMYGEQDCSRFLQEIFATVGIKLPRNSSAQARAGLAVAQFDNTTSLPEKLARFDPHGAGVFLAYMPGHIILYIGQDGDKAYAIHAVWAYREPSASGDRIRLLNRVTVSDLNLGDGSKKGSLLNRITRLVAVQ